MNSSRLITEPDFDLDQRFKVLLVDVEWSDIENLSQTIQNLNIDVTVLLFGSNDKDDIWCINAHKHSHATLVNTRFAGTKELLKGWLLAQKSTWSLGANNIAQANHRVAYDLVHWFIGQHTNYLKEEENGTQTRT